MAYIYRGARQDADTPTTKAKCGTDSGYHTHIRLKTTICEPCRIAHRVYGRKWEGGPIMRTTCGTYAGYTRHKRAGEQACELCLAGYAQYMREYRAQKQAA